MGGSDAYRNTGIPQTHLFLQVWVHEILYA